MKNNYLFLFLFFFNFSWVGCNEPCDNNPQSLINTNHLDYLYEEISVEGRDLAIIHIYSNYPEYQWIGDDDEGIACVDDATRAAVFYMNYYDLYKDEESLNKAKKLIEFILYMQADNGYFYNFIWDDYSINKTYKTSVPQPNWWTWRAIWALSEAYIIFEKVDKKFANRLLIALQLTIDRFKENFPASRETIVVEGIEIPTWLPGGSATDQASIIVMSLVNYYKITDDHEVLDYISILCNGIALMQKGDSTSIPYGAFLSWQNLWHGYGNLQSYVLLKVFETTNDSLLLDASLTEINHFYEYLIDRQYLSNFSIIKLNNEISFKDINQYSQIAYNIRTMVYTCLEAYEITNDSVYAYQAGEIASWLLGKNLAGQQMYNPDDGKCFDGINDEDNINMNSGAESTIEALLTVLAIEKNSTALRVFRNNFERNKIIPD